MLRHRYNRGLPEGVKAAWGCRAIVGEPDQVGVVWDRTSAMGTEPKITALMEHLWSLPLRGCWQDQTRAQLECGELDGGDDREVVPWKDDLLIVRANPQASCGYPYVCAYHRPVPVSQQPIGEADVDAGARAQAGGEPPCG